MEDGFLFHAGIEKRCRMVTFLMQEIQKRWKMVGYIICAAVPNA